MRCCWGEENAGTRHGKVVARLVPDRPRVAADAFRDFWDSADEIDLQAPQDAKADSATQQKPRDQPSCTGA